jgi:hypothetical protein
LPAIKPGDRKSRLRSLSAESCSNEEIFHRR